MSAGDTVQLTTVAGTSWQPGAYLAFSDHRLRPALELMQRIPLSSPRTVYDLGCGTGHVTRLLAQRWSEAEVYGLDHSHEMLARAQAEPSRIRWHQADLAKWQPPASADVLYANAVLHWLGDHETLLPRLVSYLNPGGCLAVQMPLSWSQPSHRLMRETLADGGPDGASLGTPELRRAMARPWVADTAVYYDVLRPHVRYLDIWETEYLQQLAGDDPVLQWVRATGLRPILHALTNAEREQFLGVYRQRLREAYPKRADGTTLYPFRRLFIVATV